VRHQATNKPVIALTRCGRARAGTGFAAPAIHGEHGTELVLEHSVLLAVDADGRQAAGAAQDGVRLAALSSCQHVQTKVPGRCVRSQVMPIFDIPAPEHWNVVQACYDSRGFRSICIWIRLLPAACKPHLPLLDCPLLIAVVRGRIIELRRCSLQAQSRLVLTLHPKDVVTVS